MYARQQEPKSRQQKKEWLQLIDKHQNVLGTAEAVCYPAKDKGEKAGAHYQPLENNRGGRASQGVKEEERNLRTSVGGLWHPLGKDSPKSRKTRPPPQPKTCSTFLSVHFCPVWSIIFENEELPPLECLLIIESGGNENSSPLSRHDRRGRVECGNSSRVLPYPKLHLQLVSMGKGGEHNYAARKVPVAAMKGY